MMESNLNDKPKKKRRHESNRYTLPPEIEEKASVWLKQVNEAFDGMVEIKRNAVITAVLNSLPRSLPGPLLKKIREENLTDLKTVEWMLNQLREAQRRGDNVTLEELYKTTKKSVKRTNKAKDKALKSSRVPASKSSNNTKI